MAEKGRQALHKKRPNVKRDICDYISQGYNFKEACKAVDISEGAFYAWQKKDAEFADQVNTALLAQNNKIRALARSSLMFMVQVQDVEEETSEYEISTGTDGKVIETLTKKKVTKKKILPAPNLIQYALNNLEPETFNDRHDITSGGECVKN